MTALSTSQASPQFFLDLITSHGSQARFDQTKALFPEWKSADILFQLSDADISREGTLFKDTTVQPGLLQSYLFFAIELKGKGYARGGGGLRQGFLAESESLRGEGGGGFQA